MSGLGRAERGAQEEKKAAETIGNKLRKTARGRGDKRTFLTVDETAQPLDDPCDITDATSSSHTIGSEHPQEVCHLQTKREMER